MEKSKEGISKIVNYSKSYDGITKTLKAFNEIIHYVSLDNDMKKFFKKNNFLEIIDDVSFNLLFRDFETKFSGTFLTKKGFLSFKHPYTANFEDNNIIISFSRGGKDYKISFLTDNYDKFFDEEIRKSPKGTGGIDNTIFKFESKLKETKLEKYSKTTKRMYIGFFRDYVIMENTDYVSIMDVLNKEPYDHPYYRTENTFSLEKDKQK